MVFLALGAIAKQQLRNELARDATRMLGALSHGDTPYRWDLRHASAVIAERAFGAAQVRFDDSGMHVVAAATAFEIGLVLDGALDLQRTPLVSFTLRHASHATVSLAVRETFTAPICASEPVSPIAGTGRVVLDVLALAWTCAGERSAAPVRAAMFRLRLHLPESAQANLGDVAVHPRGALRIDELRPVEIAVTAAAAAQAATMHAIRNRGDPSTWPVIALTPGAARVEQILAARDAIRRIEPAAIIVFGDDWTAVSRRSENWAVPAAAKHPATSGWGAVGALAIVLAWLRIRPARSIRLRAAAELAGVLVVPLVYVNGGFHGDDIGATWMAAIALTLAFAGSLLLGAAPSIPGALARRRGWIMAATTVAIAVTFALAVHEPQAATEWPPLARIGRYLAWAAVQQFLICVIIAGLFERLTGSAHWGVLATAAAFALLHTPNAMLMQLTFIGGLVWVWNWQCHRALLPNILAHAASGLLLAATLPHDWLRSAEVSARYFAF